MNRRKIFRAHWITIAILAVTTLAAPVSAQTKYVVTDLGTLGGTSAFPHAINNSGQVAGNSSLVGGESRGFRTAPNSPINPATDVVPTLGGTYSSASGINNLGQVAATASTLAGHSHAIRLDADGTVNDLGFLGGAIDSSNANALNDSGQVTGASDGPIPPFGPPCFGTGGLYAFRTAPNAAITPADGLGTLLGLCRYSVGYGINSAGQVVGYSAALSVFAPVDHAILATPGSGLTDLGALGGVVRFPASSGIHAVAYSINSSGQIAGTSTYNHDSSIPYYATHAFLTTAAGPMKDLGALGGSFSTATGINTFGQIVGSASTAGDAANRAFLYSGGVMNDLNSFIASSSGWELINATAINDSGQIAAFGKFSGTFHAVRLDPFDQALPALIRSLSSPALGLTIGEINSFTDKLQNALASIQQGLNTQAINQLNAFINSVQVALKTGRISATTAATLINSATQIIALLS